ncbi:carbohydrate ABC transporter permease [Streptomyces lydicus]|uniref:carbohydrate ABC transporter permease n=1 Tax=Streptomyces lydicus TaxID=47763 RepID=UPI0037A5E5E2
MSRRREHAIPYLYILPFFVIFVAFGLFPLVFTAYVSLTDWNLLHEGHHWLGGRNYTQLIADPYFWNALRNTASIWVLTTFPQLTVALVVAELLDRVIRARVFIGMGVLVPFVTSVVAVTLVFGQLFNRDFGLVNYMLHFWGVGPVDWHADRFASHIAVTTIVNWRWTGYHTLIILAAMQTIPRELNEAASLDGASYNQRFLHITLPMLRRVIMLSLLVSTIGNLQLFTEPFLFDTSSPGSVTGGTGRQFQTLGLYLYEVGFRSFRFGYASALSWTMCVVTGAATLLVYRVIRRIPGSD